MRLTACVLAAMALGAVPLEGSAAMRNYDVGDRLSARLLHQTDGVEQIVGFDRPAVVVFWATWSEPSQQVLAEIMKAAPKGGIKWQILPINVDAPTLATSDTSRVNAAARAAGWLGAVLHDRNYTIMDSWGIMSVPTIVVVNLGGTIDEIEHDWTHEIRARLFTMYFGAASDSFPGITTLPVSEQCRNAAHDARRMWRAQRRDTAITMMWAVADSCPRLPNDAARLAAWVWLSRDSLTLKDELDTVLARAHRNAWTLGARAAMAARTGDCSTAVHFSRESLALDSAFWPSWQVLAECSWKLSDTAAAEQAYSRSRALNRMEARVMSLGAALAEAKGDTTEAARLMRAAIEARLRQKPPDQMRR